MLIGKLRRSARNIGAPDGASEHIGDQDMRAVRFERDAIGAGCLRRRFVHIANRSEVAEWPRRSVRRQRDKTVALIGNQQRAVSENNSVFGPHQRPVRWKQARFVKCRGACLYSLLWRA